MDIVCGWVLENGDTRRHFDIALDQLQNRTPGRAEGLVVDQCPIDVSEPAQRIEVMLMVVVQRRFPTEPTEHRIGIGIEFDVVRVVVDAAGSADCHRYRLSPEPPVLKSVAHGCRNSVIR